jgi:hypothetical protein
MSACFDGLFLVAKGSIWQLLTEKDDLNAFCARYISNFLQQQHKIASELEEIR